MIDEKEMERMREYIFNAKPIEICLDADAIPPELMGLLGMDGQFHGDDEIDIEDEISVWPDRIVKSGRATIVFWEDGTKTVVKRSEDEPDNEYNAFCAALAIHAFGSNSMVKKIIKEQTVIQKPKKHIKEQDACPIDKPCKSEKSTMEHDSLNEKAKAQYKEYLECMKPDEAKKYSVDMWTCPNCGAKVPWQNSKTGRWAFCPRCQTATKQDIV